MCRYADQRLCQCHRSKRRAAPADPHAGHVLHKYLLWRRRPPDRLSDFVRKRAPGVRAVARSRIAVGLPGLTSVKSLAEARATTVGRLVLWPAARTNVYRCGPGCHELV